MVFAKEAQSHNDRVVASTQGEIRKPLSIFGKIIGHGGLTIFGRVEGEVRASNVVIAEGAQIVGDVVAEELTVSGHVKGTIRALPISAFMRHLRHCAIAILAICTSISTNATVIAVLAPL